MDMLSSLIYTMAAQAQFMPVFKSDAASKVNHSKFSGVARQKRQAKKLRNKNKQRGIK